MWIFEIEKLLWIDMDWYGYVLVIVGLLGLLPIIYLFYLIFSSPTSPTTSTRTLKGRKAYVVRKINPWDISGKVKLVHGNKVWSATADSEIEEGARVKITKSKSVHVVVEKVE